MVVDQTNSKSIFLPSNSNENPFDDWEIAFLSQSTKLSSLNRNSRSNYENELQQVQRDDQLETQGNMDLFTFLGLLGNGPTTINLLGQIMVISSKKDFSFLANSPNATFEYVTHPNSFRATLIELGNEAYNAFLSANSNMNHIQLNMLQIPGHVKTALKLLATAPFAMLEKLLPLSLNHIERIGQECSTLSTVTHNKFADVQYLIGEINVLTAVSFGVTDQKLSETLIELNKTVAAKNALKEKEIILKQRYEEQAAKVRQAQQNFDKALSQIPTGWDSIKQQMVGAIVDTYKSVVSGVTCTKMMKHQCESVSIGSTAQTASENAITAAKERHLALQNAEAQYDRIFNELMLHHNNMTEVIVQLAALDMTKIDFEQLIPILEQAITYLSHIRKHWGELIEFFDTLRIRVQIVQKNSFAKFVEWMKSTQGMGNDFLTQEIRGYYLDMLKDDVVEIHREAHLLYIMSKTYYDVSREHMMGQLACLAKMITASSDEERNKLTSELMQDTQIIQTKIGRLALQRKNEYELANEQRQKEIELYIQEITLQGLQQNVGRKRRHQLFLS